MPEPIMPGANPAPQAAAGGSVFPGQEIPLSIRLDPEKNGEFHSKIKSRVMARAQMADRHLNNRKEIWKRTDDTMGFYLDLSQQAIKGDGSTDSESKEMPFQRGIVIPASFAVHQVRVTELFGTVVSREPVYQYDGRTPSDVTPSKKLEAMVAYDYGMSNGNRVTYSFLADSDKYGNGIIYDVWEDEIGNVITGPPPIAQLQQTLGLPESVLYSPGMKRKFPWLYRPKMKVGVKSEGNRWSCVDPYDYLPDPRVPISEPQRGEFCGHFTREAHVHLVMKDESRGGPYFNLQYAKKHGGPADRRPDSGDQNRRRRFHVENYELRSNDEKDSGFYSLCNMQIRLIPREWGLSSKDSPEIWWFTLLNEELVIRAHPSAYGHDQFTYVVGEVNPDPHQQFNPGMVELMDGLQRMINWLCNSRVENIRLALNNFLIYIAKYISEKDLLNPGPMMHVRLTQEGEDAIIERQLTIDSMIKQFQVNDVTGAHMEMVQFFYEMMQRMASSTDAAQGQPLPDKRTLGELQMITGGASSRNLTTVRIMDAMAFTPLAKRAAANRQQFTTMRNFFRLVGDLLESPALGLEPGQDRMPIGAMDIQGEFDYVPQAIAKAPDPARDAETWARILSTGASVPEVAMPDPVTFKKLDFRKVFNEMVRRGGVKNVEEFYTMVPQMAPPQVLPDAQVQAGVQAGNLVPLSDVPSGGVQ